MLFPQEIIEKIFLYCDIETVEKTGIEFPDYFWKEKLMLDYRYDSKNKIFNYLIDSFKISNDLEYFINECKKKYKEKYRNTTLISFKELYHHFNSKLCYSCFKITKRTNFFYPDERVCWNCEILIEKYNTIAATNIAKKYYLKKEELEELCFCIKHIHRKNFQYYLESDVKQLSIKKFGNLENMEKLRSKTKEKSDKYLEIKNMKNKVLSNRINAIKNDKLQGFSLNDILREFDYYNYCYYNTYLIHKVKNCRDIYNRYIKNRRKYNDNDLLDELLEKLEDLTYSLSY